MQIERILKAFATHKVEYIIVGGVAAVIHGSSYSTNDFDICYRRTTKNIERLVQAIAPFRPRLRGKSLPKKLPFQFSFETIRSGLNFTLTTDAGDVDLFGEIQGLGTYEQVVDESENIDAFGIRCKVLRLSALIKAKKAISRDKDQAVIKELSAILELRKGSNRL